MDDAEKITPFHNACLFLSLFLPLPTILFSFCCTKMVKDISCSLAELERFLREHEADKGIFNALGDVRSAIYDYQIKSIGLQSSSTKSMALPSNSSKGKLKNPFQAFLESALCGCFQVGSGNVQDDEPPVSQSVHSEIKSNDEGSEPLTPRKQRKGWTVGESQRRAPIDYESEEQYQKQLKHLGKNWHLDIMALSNFKTCLQNGPIVCMGQALINPVGERIHPEFNLKVGAVLTMIQDVYLPNPYHNALHGACVAHMAAVFAEALGLKKYMTPIEEFAYIIAGLGHDAGHPGKTNAFLRSTQNSLALIYNDTSILENYHASLICHILRSEESFFQIFSQQEWETIRKRIIQLVLATDMMSHFTHVNNVKERRLNGSLDYKNNAEDLWYIMVLCIKAADIGHNFLPWCDHLPWTKVLFDEFHMQGDEERLLSMPLLLFFDRSRSADIPDSQLGFFQGFTMPLVEELMFVNPESDYIKRYIVKNANDNLENWKKHSKRTLDEIARELEESDEVFEVEDALVS